MKFALNIFKNTFMEDNMAKKWDYDEKILIEVFGCASLDKNIIELSGYKKSEMYKSDFYLNGSTLEGMLIETFGCVSLDKIINIDVSRERRRIELPLTQEELPGIVVGLA